MTDIRTVAVTGAARGLGVAMALEVAPRHEAVDRTAIAAHTPGEAGRFDGRS